ncbi:MAG: hypothetical protein H6733_05345 [Alphaproteobacteria bacterium]|nr:hypothetical protein [Alphaproteobacteria bacterium]
METEDPRAALEDKSIARRAAGARDLMRWGSWADMELLVDKGWKDPSMPVRLYAAAAAADIACRRRGAWGQESLDELQQAQLLKWAFAGDPGVNPSMLMLVGAVQTEGALARLARIVRDPRSDVRLGVVTALRRMVLSAVADRALVTGHVASWLADDRLQDDTRAELIKIIGEAGLPALRQAVLSARQRGDAMAEVADQALDRLDARGRPETWSGAWVTDGLDVFELALAPRADGIAVSTPTVWAVPGAHVPLALHDGGATLGGEPAAIVWATPLGTAVPRKALHEGGRTWWSVPADEVAEFVEARWSQLAAMDPEAVAALRAWIDTQEGPSAQRAGAIACWLAGEHAEARTRLDAMLDRKRPRIDLFWWRGRVLADLGQAADARDDLATFLDKTKGDAPFRAEAEALLAELG